MNLTEIKEFEYLLAYEAMRKIRLYYTVIETKEKNLIEFFESGLESDRVKSLAAHYLFWVMYGKPILEDFRTIDVLKSVNNSNFEHFFVAIMYATKKFISKEVTQFIYQHSTPSQEFLKLFVTRENLPLIHNFRLQRLFKEYNWFRFLKEEYDVVYRTDVDKRDEKYYPSIVMPNKANKNEFLYFYKYDNLEPICNMTLPYRNAFRYASRDYPNFCFIGTLYANPHYEKITPIICSGSVNLAKKLYSLNNWWEAKSLGILTDKWSIIKSNIDETRIWSNIDLRPARLNTFALNEQEAIEWVLANLNESKHWAILTRNGTQIPLEINIVGEFRITELSYLESGEPCYMLEGVGQVPKSIIVNWSRKLHRIPNNNNLTLIKYNDTYYGYRGKVKQDYELGNINEYLEWLDEYRNK